MSGHIEKLRLGKSSFGLEARNVLPKNTLVPFPLQVSDMIYGGS